eukprot:scaffold143185_cov16-Prasinocladus_malaysianus.AAC.1
MTKHRSGAIRAADVFILSICTVVSRRAGKPRRSSAPTSTFSAASLASHLRPSSCSVRWTARLSPWRRSLQRPTWTTGAHSVSEGYPRTCDLMMEQRLVNPGDRRLGSACAVLLFYP